MAYTHAFDVTLAWPGNVFFRVPRTDSMGVCVCKCGHLRGVTYLLIFFGVDVIDISGQMEWGFFKVGSSIGFPVAIELLSLIHI